MYDVEKLNFTGQSTSDEFLNTGENKVRQMPFEAVIYQLCQLFHCLPSEILDEDNQLISDILTMHNTFTEVDEKHREMQEKNKQNKINMKMSKHITIGLELEKLGKSQLGK